MNDKYENNKVVNSYIPEIDNNNIISKRNKLVSKAPWPFSKIFLPLDNLESNISS